MTDLEKVIKGLECCIWKEQQGKCEECPYHISFCIKKDAYQLKEDALALLKAQEPRVMTAVDMEDAEPGTVIWCEQRDEVRTYLTPMIKYDDGVFENRFLAAEPQAADLYNTRFWTSRPTDEQREAVKWE